MTTGQIICLIAAAGAGGAINAVAGGGTLVTFPTLLLVGTPPVVANATSTLALLIGNSGGILGYRQHVVSQPKSHFWPLQWAESGLYLAASGVLTALAFWWTRRRLS